MAFSNRAVRKSIFTLHSPSACKSSTPNRGIPLIHAEQTQWLFTLSLHWSWWLQNSTFLSHSHTFCVLLTNWIRTLNTHETFPTKLPGCLIVRSFTCFRLVKFSENILIVQHEKRFRYEVIYTYLLTYLLTYSMEQSPSWEANRFCS